MSLEQIEGQVDFLFVDKYHSFLQGGTIVYDGSRKTCQSTKNNKFQKRGER